jgi:alkaline phosphatase D
MTFLPSFYQGIDFVKKKKTALSTTTLSTLLLAACGGGGGGSEPTTTLEGTAINGPLQGARVGFDLDNDGNLSDAETLTRTAEDGSFTLPNLTAEDAARTIMVQADEQTIDTVKNASVDNLILRAPAGYDVVSPITTLVGDGVNPDAILEVLGINGDITAEELKTYNPYDPVNKDNAEANAKAVKLATVSNHVSNTVKALAATVEGSGVDQATAIKLAVDSVVTAVATKATQAEKVAYDFSSDDVTGSLAQDVANTLTQKLTDPAVQSALNVADIDVVANKITQKSEDAVKALVNVTRVVQQQSDIAAATGLNVDSDDLRDALVLSEALEQELVSAAQNDTAVTLVDAAVAETTAANKRPSLELSSREIAVGSSSLEVGTIIGFDPEDGTNVTYSLGGIDADKFIVDPISGKLSVVDADSISVERTFSITLTVTDSQNKSTTTQYDIDVVAALENAAPVVVRTNDVSVFEGTSIVSHEGVVLATDRDGDELTFSTESTGKYGSFAIDQSTGAYSYTLQQNNADVRNLADGEILKESFVINVSDGTEVTSTTLNVLVRGTNNQTGTNADDIFTIGKDDTEAFIFTGSGEDTVLLGSYLDHAHVHIADFSLGKDVISFGAGVTTNDIIVSENELGDIDLTLSKDSGDLVVTLSSGLSNLTSNQVSDALETIVLTDTPLLRVGDIQGTTLSSAFVDKTVVFEAVVTHADGNYFRVADPVGYEDGDILSSDALKIAFPEIIGDAVLEVGSIVRVTGAVQEYYGATQLYKPSVELLSFDMDALPDVVDLSAESIPSVHFDDLDGVIERDEDGLYFWESLEHMEVSMPAAQAVQPTDFYKDSFVAVVTNTGETVLTSETSFGGALLTENADGEVDRNPEIFILEAFDSANDFYQETGDILGANDGIINGFVDYSFDTYRVRTDDIITVTSENQNEREVTSLESNGHQLTVATYNVRNMSVANNETNPDGSERNRFDELAKQIVNNLKTPDIIALQEIQDDTGETDDGVVTAEQTLARLIAEIAEETGSVTYTAAEIAPVDKADGGAPGANIRVAYLYNAERVELVEGSLQRIEGPAFDENGDAVAGDPEGVATGSGTDLLFTEYAEGSSNNKYIEITNPTNQDISLDGYAFPNASNGADGQYEFWNSFTPGAVIKAGGTYVIAHPSADASILAKADQTHQYLSNGDDGYALVKGTESDYVIIDMIGDFGVDPGSGWDVAGVTNATQNHTLVRKASVVSGNTDWNASRGTNADDSEWIVLENDAFINNNWSGLGYSGEQYEGGATNGTYAGTRKPLMATFEFNGEQVTIVNVHNKSKSGSDDLTVANQPPQDPNAIQRADQFDTINEAIKPLVEAGQKVVVLGDFNDYEWDVATDALTALESLTETAPSSDRWSYNYDGNSQILDQIHVSKNILSYSEIDHVHVNTDFDRDDWDYQTSDHDPVVMRIDFDLFQHGVASGDPDASSVVLWTHVASADAQASGTWEVATTADFDTIVSSGAFTTDASEDYTVKVIADGLEAGTEYFYRFHYNDDVSDVGRTKTLPTADSLGADGSVTMGIFSCANYPAGYFHPYAEAAANNYDVLVHLGDSIYEYAPGGYASDLAEQLGRVVEPASELLTLDDYNDRYAQYTTDADWQAARASAPLIMMWDDHETANDAYQSGAENHNEGEGDWAERRDDALEAYFNWNPIREPADAEFKVDNYKSYDFGDLVSLHMLETRLTARDEQLSYPTSEEIGLRIADILSNADLAATYASAAGGVDLNTAEGQTALANLVAGEMYFAVAAQAATDPEQNMIGAEQMSWLKGEMSSSDAAGTVWQILGSQTLMTKMELPIGLLASSDPATLGAYYQALGQALSGDSTAYDALNVAKLPYNLDAWDGYGVEREEIYDTAEQLGVNLISIAGDTHNAWLGSLTDADGNSVGYEFATAGVSAPGLESYFNTVDPVIMSQLWKGYVDDLEYANTGNRGYLELEFTRDDVTSIYHFVDTVIDEEYTTTSQEFVKTLADFPYAEVVDAPNNPVTGTVSIGGEVVEGSELTATNDLSDADGLGALSYQWLADGTAIEGATSSTYVLTSSEVGKTITVDVSFTDQRGTLESKSSDATAKVTAKAVETSWLVLDVQTATADELVLDVRVDGDKLAELAPNLTSVSALTFVLDYNSLEEFEALTGSDQIASFSTKGIVSPAIAADLDLNTAMGATFSAFLAPEDISSIDASDFGFVNFVKSPAVDLSSILASPDALGVSSNDGKIGELTLNPKTTGSVDINITNIYIGQDPEPVLSDPDGLTYSFDIV